MPEGKQREVELDASLCRKCIDRIVETRGSERKRAVIDFLASVLEITKSATEAADLEEQQ
jgi:hypothetical protein